MSSSNASGRAYIGSFTSAGGRGVVAAAVNAGTGGLTVLGASDAVADPSFLALERGGRVLYAVSESEDGAVAAFDVSGDGAPVPTGPGVPVGGAGPTHLALAAGHLVTANYRSGSVTVLPVAADGTPEAATGVMHHRGNGPDQDRQAGPHAHQVRADPTGRWVLSVDLGTDSVRVCELAPATGTLRVHTETVLRPGTGPRHLAFHPDGGHAYVLCELEPVLTVCRWDAESGVLIVLGEVPVVASGTERAAYPSEIVVSHDGRFLWAAVRGTDSIAVLELGEAGAKAQFVAEVDCGGRWPRDLALDPTGRRLYAANERSGDVSWFDIDDSTGIPHPAGSVEVPAASCVVFG
ncbi:lactonase family protein [Streptomyces hypolithicus]